MVIVRVSRMMSNDHIRLALLDGVLNKLYQLQVRHSIHLNIRERTLVYFIHPKELIRSIGIIFQFIVL